MRDKEAGMGIEALAGEENRLQGLVVDTHQPFWIEAPAGEENRLQGLVAAILPSALSTCLQGERGERADEMLRPESIRISKPVWNRIESNQSIST